MNKKQQNFSKIYQRICIASQTGRKRGLSIKDLKKEFGLHPRDIEKLISFLNNYDAIDDPLYFHIYRLTSHYMSQKKQKAPLSFDNLDEDDTKDCDLGNISQFLTPQKRRLIKGNIEGSKLSDNDIYIRIENDFAPILDKILEGDIDLTNATFIHSLTDDMAKISDYKMPTDYVLLKEERNGMTSNIRKRKIDWILTVVTSNMVSMTYYKTATFQTEETVLPLGMYYNQFLDKYFCVYQKGEKKYHEIPLDKISVIKPLEDEYGNEVRFNIEKYIKRTQTIRIILRVYKEANVVDKLEKLLKDNQLSIDRGELYDTFTFKVNDERQYISMLKSYGKSVIVMEPANLRKEMIESTNKALEFYQNIPEEYLL